MERKNKIYLGIILIFVFSIIFYDLIKEINSKNLIDNDFLLTNRKPSELRENLSKSKIKLYRFEIDCGDEFMQKGDELYLKFKTFVQFKNGIALADINFKSEEIKYAPILYLIRKNKVYMKTVKEKFTLYHKKKSYKIQICDSFNRILSG